MDTGLGMLLLPSGVELGDLCPLRPPSQHWQEGQHACQLCSIQDHRRYLRNVQFSSRRSSDWQFSRRQFSRRQFSNRELINGQLTNMRITLTRFSSDSKPISNVNRSISNVKKHCSR